MRRFQKNVIARELTKIFEEHLSHNIDELIKLFEDTDPKGEYTILLEGIEKSKNTNLTRLN